MHNFIPTSQRHGDPGDFLRARVFDAPCSLLPVAGMPQGQPAFMAQTETRYLERIAGRIGTRQLWREGRGQHKHNLLLVPALE